MITIYSGYESEIPADSFEIQTILEEKAGSPARVTETLKTRLNAASEAIAGAGLDTQNLSVSAISIKPDYDFDRKLFKKEFIGSASLSFSSDYSSDEFNNSLETMTSLPGKASLGVRFFVKHSQGHVNEVVQAATLEAIGIARASASAAGLELAGR